MKKQEMGVVLGIAFLAIASNANAQSWAAGAPIPTPSAIRAGAPVMRSVEYTYNRPAMDPGPYRAAGYRSWISGLAASDLFAPPTSSLTSLLAAIGTANETTARFTHTEAGCLQSVIPKTLNLAGVLSLNLAEPTETTTHARARQCVYYTATPANRSWLYPNSFSGKLAAVFHLVDETDFIDLKSQVGVGTATVEVACANDVKLPSGQVFNFGKLASSYVADFQFQIVPKASPAPNSGWQAYGVVFLDSGVWKVLERNAVPACGTDADVCAKPVQPCP